MTTARQARTIFRPLASRHADFAYTGGRELWLTPIRHTVSSVFLDRTSNSDAFRVRWAILASFIPTPNRFESIGNCAGDLYPFDQTRFAYWHWSDSATVERAISVIETNALPHLRSLSGLERWAAYYRETFPIALAGFPDERLLLDIALGNLQAARSQLTELLPHFRENKHPDQPIYQYMRSLILPVAEPLLADDRPALAAILHGWESENIRGAKLEPYWEPTPFPLERAPV
ncbi:hypothetical protein [Methylobacterium sp. J-090]|uniref:hypothetical protein n=1 Tax=Methylobacterium sp. J-090 TaxID=2836666 RepID=UPI001FBB06A1|nr:hypothetical protein [Methylobacterium sp. J-090]MCJ2080096.1 hypothetical protein [Methylobacterium sp. J-090]